MPLQQGSNIRFFTPFSVFDFCPKDHLFLVYFFFWSMTLRQRAPDLSRQSSGAVFNC
jgi:hypothetical protein